MVDPPQQLSPPQGSVRLPVRPSAGRNLVLLTVFVCAACGLVYELELVALASYLIGDSVTQASVVLSLMVFAMGIGSLLAKRLRCRAAVGFGVLELALALVGGCSALVLYASFAWIGEARSVLVGFSLAIGVLIGAEIPLLMSLIQRISRRDAEGTVADLFAADYVGALVGGLAFPFLLLPWLGQLTAGLLTGAVNALAGGALVLWLFRRELTPAPAAGCSSPTSSCSASSAPRPFSSTTSRRPRGPRSTGTGCGSPSTPECRKSSSPEAVPPPWNSSWTAGSVSAGATSTATTRDWSTPPPPARAVGCSSSAAATGSPPARCCATATSKR